MLYFCPLALCAHCLPHCRAITLALGSGHPIAQLVEQVADRNVSDAARRAAAARKRQQVGTRDLITPSSKCGVLDFRY